MPPRSPDDEGAVVVVVVGRVVVVVVGLDRIAPRSPPEVVVGVVDPELVVPEPVLAVPVAVAVVPEPDVVAGAGAVVGVVVGAATLVVAG
jgi:hypothetical protein